MPLLMCPNCSASMSEVKRNDVAFDMCPTCRGVWLDRGELEKIIAGAKDERGAFEQERAQFYQDPDGYRRSHPQQPPQQYQQPPQQPPQQQPQQGYGERGESGERGEGGYDQRGGQQQQRRRRGGFDLMDIFGD